MVRKWSPPDFKWVKVNTNGACISGGNSTACRGVLRDSVGHWMQGFNCYLGKGSVLSAELNGALQGLNLVWEIGFKKVWLEMDSVEGLELIQQGFSFTHPCVSLIQQITDLIARSWEVNFSHTCRDSNKVADYLAKMALRERRNFNLFGVPPTGCLAQYFEDSQSIEYCNLTLLVSRVVKTG